MVSQAIFNLIGLTRFQAMLPQTPGPLLVLGMEHAVPTLSIGGAIGNAGEFIPACVEIIMIAVGQGRPHHLRHGIGQHLQLGFAHLQGSLRVELAFDFDICAQPADDFARFICHRHDAGKKTPEHSVGSPNGKQHFERLSACNRLLPSLHHTRQFGGVVDALPAPSFHGLWSRAAIVVPAAVIPEYIAVAAGHPAQGRHIIGNQTEIIAAGHFRRICRVDGGAGNRFQPIAVRRCSILRGSLMQHPMLSFIRRQMICQSYGGALIDHKSCPAYN